MTRTRKLRLFATMVVAALAACAAANQGHGYVTVYGSQTFDAASNTGYRFAEQVQFIFGKYVNNNGAAIGVASRYLNGANEGVRSLRWSASQSPSELGLLGTDGAGLTQAYPISINNAGTVVGHVLKYDANVGGPFRAVRWDAAGNVTELGLLDLPEADSYAYDVNTSGTTVGSVLKRDVGQVAVRWEAGGTTATELGHLGVSRHGTTYARAIGVNDAGTAIGVAQFYDANGDYDGARSVRWDAGSTTATVLGDLNLFTFGEPIDINNAGTVVGHVQKGWLGERAVRWDAGGTSATELDALGFIGGSFTNTWAWAVNEAGVAAGFSLKAVGGVSLGHRAVRWDANGTTVTELGDLGTDNGITNGEARDVNAAGVAVGYMRRFDAGASLGDCATAWKPDNVAIDLNDLIDPTGGWRLTSANSISNTGWIAGVGQFDPDGSGGQAAYSRLFVMQIPEPGAGVLSVLGAIALSLKQRGSRL